MEKMSRLFQTHPPKKPLNSLANVIADWKYRFGKNGISKEMRDEVVDLCAKLKTAEQAVWAATNSLRPNGKLHNHQSRVPKRIRDNFAIEILAQQSYQASTFDQLYDDLEIIAPTGIGPVTLYDVATRIAAWRKLPVESLYLHAGVRVGWCLLYGRRSPDVLRIPRWQLPKEVKQSKLPTDEFEDMLCAYRQYIKPWCKGQWR